MTHLDANGNSTEARVPGDDVARFCVLCNLLSFYMLQMSNVMECNLGSHLERIDSDFSLDFYFTALELRIWYPATHPRDTNLHAPRKAPST